MNALAFPCPPGSTWTWQGTRVTAQVFPASGQYTPSPGLVACVVECVGGGGGSGPAVGFANYITSGGGGGSGGYSRIALPAPLVAGGVAVTVGAGGAPSASLPPGPESTGGTTSFGALCVANGGGGGYGNSGVNEWGNGGPPAAPGVGDIASPGSFGFNGETTFTTTGGPMVNMLAWGGRGATTMFGGGNQDAAAPGAIANGVAGAYYGAGATGGVSNQINATTAQGAAGAAGVCIVTEYCVAQSGGSDCGCGPARVSYGWGC
jgi:hypothetical protein